MTAVITDGATVFIRSAAARALDTSSIAGAQAIRARPSGWACAAGKLAAGAIADVSAIGSTRDGARGQRARIVAGSSRTHASDAGQARRTFTTVHASGTAITDDAAVLATSDLAAGKGLANTAVQSEFTTVGKDDDDACVLLDASARVIG
jgi:hypothetical protein